MSLTLSNVLRLTKPGVYMHWCLGCKSAHHINTSSTDHPRGEKWSFNGDLFRPTFSPSVKISEGSHEDDGDLVPARVVCHYYITAGRIEYLGDCTHAYRGQTVELPDFPMRQPT